MNQVAWSPDGNYLATTYADQSRVYVINLHTGQIVYTYSGPATVADLAWSPNSKYIAAGEDGKISSDVRVWATFT